jgi:hypothetical protein
MYIVNLYMCMVGMVHLDKVLQSVVPLEGVVHLGKVLPLGQVVHPDKVLPLEGEVPLNEEVPLEKPALSLLAEDMPAQGELVVDKLKEQHKRKLHQMEADNPAVNVIAYMCILAKLENGEGLRIGMDPLRGV